MPSAVAFVLKRAYPFLHILVDVLNRPCAFAHSSGDAFRRVKAYIADRENSRHARLEAHRLSGQRERTEINIAPRADKSFGVALKQTIQPVRVRRGSD